MERDTRRREEDLSKAPTPETRRADEEPAREHDTSEGPTPTTREAERTDSDRS
jgi:hypothetical protein